VGGVKASLDRVRAFGNAIGVAVGTGGVAMLSNSVLSGNTSAGLETEGTSVTLADHVVVSGNNIGIQVVGGTTDIANTDVAFNTTCISGTVNSFTNSRFFQNGGTCTVSQIGPANTNPSGQQ